MLRDIKIDLQYQPTIPGPPPSEGNLLQRSAVGDRGTMDAWRETWLKNYKANKDRFGSFAERSLGGLHGLCRHKPIIICGSGPSLKYSLDSLRNNANVANPVMVISCLHNFGLFKDEGIKVDYWLTMDAGKIVIDDISESCKKESYWEDTAGENLLAGTFTPPELFEQWKGNIYLFNSLIPDLGIRAEMDKIEKFTHYVSSGGNAGGACFYFGKTLFGADPIIFVGIDMCFGYDNQFHSYKTHYDQLGECLRWVDIFGNARRTWPSYLNFKFWLDHQVTSVPGNYITCSEGILGAYMQGNIAQYKYMPLSDAMIPYQSADALYLEEITAGGERTGKKDLFNVGDYWKDSQYKLDMVFF